LSFPSLSCVIVSVTTNFIVYSVFKSFKALITPLLFFMNCLGLVHASFSSAELKVVVSLFIPNLASNSLDNCLPNFWYCPNQPFHLFSIISS